MHPSTPRGGLGNPAVLMSSSVDSSSTVLPPAADLISPVPDLERLDLEKGRNIPGPGAGEEDSGDSPPPASQETPRGIGRHFSRGGKLQPFRLLKQDFQNLKRRYYSDWTVFNQLVLASAVYVFFTNILPGITFASDLYVLTGQSWGTIEVVFSTGLCGIIFSM